MESNHLGAKSGSLNSFLLMSNPNKGCVVDKENYVGDGMADDMISIIQCQQIRRSRSDHHGRYLLGLRTPRYSQNDSCTPKMIHVLPKWFGP